MASKAGRWARQGRDVMRFRERLSPYERRCSMVPFVATVGLRGKMLLGEDSNDMAAQTLSPKEALRLARWILDTFGEGA